MKQKVYNKENIANEMSAIWQKPILTAKEMANYMGIALSTLYKMTHQNIIPFSKPNGKMIFFDRVEVENWMRSNRYSTQEEAKQQAFSYCKKGGAR